MLLLLQPPMTDREANEENKARGDKVLIRGSRVAIKYLLFITFLLAVFLFL